MKNILFIWKVPAELRVHLEKSLDSSKFNLLFPDKDAYAEEVKDVDVIVGWQPTAEMLDNAKKLKLFINPGAGIQHLEEFKEAFLGCTVVNGHGNAFNTAEHIIAMLLSLTNRLQQHHQWMQQGKWRLGDKKAPSVSLKNRKVGFLGYGHINKQVLEFLRPYACEISILRRKPSTGEYGPDELHKFLKEIDVLISTIPLTAETENLIGERELELLGKDAILINAGRGKTFNEEALYNALKEDVIQSAAIDVWYEYKPEADDEGKMYPYKFPFYTLDNILLSPHRAASPFGDLERWDDVIENLNRFANGRTDFLKVVDLELGY